MMTTGFGTKSGVVLRMIGLVVSLLAIPFCAWGGGGDSVKKPHFPPAHGLPDRACSSDSHPSRSDRSTWASSSRSHSVAQPHSRRSGDRRWESTADLAQRINTLAKNSSTWGRRELAIALDQLPKDRRFADATPKDLALLINGIGKLLEGRGDQSAAIRILNTLAREVCRQDLGDRRWQQQDAALVVNGLSKAKGSDITRALTAVARKIVHREMGYWTAQNLALVVCGISKAEGKEITDCRKVLAREIVGQNLRRWPSHHLAMVISGLSKGEGETIHRALKVLAQEVIDRKQKLDQWTEQHLAMVINGLSKGRGDRTTRALNLLAKTVIKRNYERDQWQPQTLTMVINGFSKGVGEEIAQALNLLARTVIQQRRQLHRWSEPNLAIITNGLSKGTGKHITRALTGLSQVVLDRQQQLDQWAAQHLVMVINGLSQRRGEQYVEVLNVLARVVADRRRELSQWSDQQLLIAVNGLSKGTGAEITRALEVLAQAVLDRQQQLGQWEGRDFAMVVNGLSKGTGEEVSKALTALAQAVLNHKQELSQWMGPGFALVVNGLSKGTGDHITRALKALARAMIQGKQELSQWPVQDLAMVVNGLSKETGADITKALNALALTVIRRKQELSQWPVQDLAMVATGLSKNWGAESEKCCQILAQHVVGRDLGSWTNQQLAMMTKGISKVTEAGITESLKTLAKEIAGRDLSQWAPQSLAIAVGGMGQISQNPVFGQLITELVNRATQEPIRLLIALKNLCHFQLSREHIDAAFSLLKALHQSGYRPDGTNGRNQLLWCLTLVHFRDQQVGGATGASGNRGDQLAQLYRHYVEIEGDWSESDHVVDPKADDQQDLGTQRWHKLFVRDYWQGEHQQWRRGRPSSPTILPSGAWESVSQLQMNIYQALKKTPPYHQVELEVSVNEFPVDILIDRRICIEVDGPLHYLQPELNPDSQSPVAQTKHGDSALSVLPSLPGERRAKDRFIDHMLEQYGYRVFRIPYTYGPESPEFGEIIRQILASLANNE